ncbi:hypothetical protein B9Z50_05275 [Limnohabitans sp. Bal53]|nr:hypothetical protein B9Z50_05275 [Limnohabitans sp. Bal53]
MNLSSLWQALPRATAPAALGSLVSLAAQGFLALVLFRLFSPEEVGMFSATSQLAFFWASLALAQSPLSLLAERHQEPRAAARRAWRQSAWRLLWLAPVAGLGAFWSGLGDAVQVWAWAAALGLAQLSWLLAQSLTLRLGSRWSVGLVRMVPPVLAAAAAVLGAVLFPERGEGLELPVLLVSACLGYLAGAVWMRLAFQSATVPDAAGAAKEGSDLRTATAEAPPSSDPRSARLKMLHTLSDGLAATALALSWPAHYGAQEAGWLLALLRILSFIPALVHTAWAQVVLSSSTKVQLRPLKVAWAASALVLGVGALAQLALTWGWLDARWQGLSSYVWPLVLWQTAACFVAAHAHLPFQKGLAVQHAWLCVAMNAGFIALCVVLPWAIPLSASTHMAWLSAYMLLSLTALTLWVAKR